MLAELKSRVLELREKLKRELAMVGKKLAEARAAGRTEDAARIEEETRTLTEQSRHAACLVLLDNVCEPVLLAEPQLAQIPREDWLRVVVTTREGPEKFPASRQKSLAFIAVDALTEDDAARLIEDHQLDGRWPAATAAADAAAARERSPASWAASRWPSRAWPSTLACTRTSAPPITSRACEPRA